MKKKKKNNVKGSRHAGLDPSYPPANLRLCWWLGVPAVAAAAAAGVGGVGMVWWWCGGVVVIQGPKRRLHHRLGPIVRKSINISNQ